MFVPVEQLRRALATLPKVLPEGRSFGFAHEDEVAWFSPMSNYDPDHYVQYARTLLDE